MGQVPADDGAGRVTGGGDRRDVHQLAGQVVDAAEQHESGVRPQSVDDVLGPQAVLTGAGLQPDDRVLRLEPVEARLRPDGVAVGRKGRVLDDDPEPLGSRAEERDHQQVQVDGERVHHHRLTRQRADQPGSGCRQQLVVRQPGALGVQVPFDPERGPGVEIREQLRTRRLRPEPERVAGEVRDVRGGPAVHGRYVEQLAMSRILGVERERLGLGAGSRRFSALRGHAWAASSAGSATAAGGSTT
jgi:hypothetical protein